MNDDYFISVDLFLHHETSRARKVSKDGRPDHAVWVPKTGFDVEVIEIVNPNGSILFHVDPGVLKGKGLR